MFFILLTLEIAALIVGIKLLLEGLMLWGGITLGIAILSMISTVYYYKLRHSRIFNDCSNSDCGSGFWWFGDCDCDGPKGFDCDTPDCDCSPDCSL